MAENERVVSVAMPQAGRVVSEAIDKIAEQGVGAMEEELELELALKEWTGFSDAQ